MRHSRKNAKREVLESLCKTGEWVGLTILSFRLEMCTDMARTALRELVADGHAETKELPRQWKVMQREKVYRAAAGANPSAVPFTPPGPSDRQVANDAQVMGIVTTRGQAQIEQVSQAAKVSKNQAGKVLKRLVDSGALIRYQGPLPPVGGTRPWIYEVAP